MRSAAYVQMRKRLVDLAKSKKQPILGHFELTARCNLDCKMCYVHTQDNAKALRNELSTDQWKRIFDEAYDMGLLYATLSGGECLLRKDFKELYLYLWNKHVKVSVFSNGVLIDDEYVDFFKKYPPDYIQISIYGSNNDGYFSVTGQRVYDKVVASINALDEAGVDVRVVITPSKYMGDDYINVYRFCKEKKFLLNKTDITLIPNRDNPDKDDYFLSEDEIFMLLKSREELTNELIPVLDTPDPFGSVCCSIEKGFECNAGNCLASVTWDGKMYACLNAMVGGASLLEMSYADAWTKTSRSASEVLRPVECVGCAYDKICPKCLSSRVRDLQSGHCNPAVCRLTRRLVSAGIKKIKSSN